MLYMAGDWVGPGASEKMDVVCPKCGTRNEVLWIPPQRMTYRSAGTTGISENKHAGKSEKVEGECKECGYKFKTDDL